MSIPLVTKESPVSSPAQKRFESYLNRVIEALRADPRVVGLVGMGSTAERWRVDEWSDHDLAIIVEAGAEDEFRHGRDWIPGRDRLVIDVVEWHGGAKLVFDDGHVVELGVATTDSLRAWAVHHHDVLIDNGGVADAVADAVEHSAYTRNGDLSAQLNLVVATVRIGAGKALRGEVLAGGDMLRHDAIGHLLAATAITSPLDRHSDLLDPRRRVERTHPELATALAEAIRQPELQLAHRLLDLLENHFGHLDTYPRRGVDAVRRRLELSALNTA